MVNPERRRSKGGGGLGCKPRAIGKFNQEVRNGVKSFGPKVGDHLHLPCIFEDKVGTIVLLHEFTRTCKLNANHAFSWSKNTCSMAESERLSEGK